MTRGVSKNLWTIGAMLQTLPVDRLLPRQVQLDFVFLMDHLGSFINDLPTFPWGHVTSALDHCSTCISEVCIRFRHTRLNDEPYRVVLSAE